MRYTPQAVRPAVFTDTVPTCVRNYLNQGAPKGQRNDTLFRMAAQCMNAGIAESMIRSQLMARAVLDGLSGAEADKTISSAYAGQPLPPPVGPGKHSAPPPGAKQFVPPPSSARPFSMPLPSPMADGFKLYLENNFQAGEGVSISDTVVKYTVGNPVERNPGDGHIKTRENWLADLKSVENYNLKEEGVFIRINPTTGSYDKDVTAFRMGLFESDKISKEQQYAALINSRLPIRAIVDSGKRSIHGIVCLDAPDRAEYDRRYALALSSLEGCSMCPQNSNPARYSRVPGVARKIYDEQGNYTHTSRQKLLALNVGEATWDEWESKYCKDPKRLEIERILRFRKVSELSQVQPVQLIDGILYEGTKMMFGAPSKSFKTWNLLHSLFCLANGLPYLGHVTPKKPVVHFDFELLEFDLWWRLSRIAAAYNLPGDPFENLHVVSLFGQLIFGEQEIDFRDSAVREFVIEELRRTGAKAFSIDPLYMTYCGEEENSNSATIMSKFDPILRATGAALITNHHYAKGDPTEKHAFDRFAGAGMFYRNIYTGIAFTPHAVTDAFTVNYALRGFAPIDPHVVRWQFPLMVPDLSLDPNDLASSKTKAQRAAKADSQDRILAAIYGAEREGGLTKNQLAFVLNVDPKTIKRNADKLIAKGEIIQSTDPGNPYQLSSQNAAAWLKVSP